MYSLGYEMFKIASVSGALPQTPLGELTTLPQTPGGLGCHDPQIEFGVEESCESYGGSDSVPRNHVKKYDTRKL